MNLHSGGDELVGNPAIITERSAVMAEKKKPQADFHRPNEIPPLGLQITLIEDTLGVLETLLNSPQSGVPLFHMWSSIAISLPRS